MAFTHIYITQLDKVSQIFTLIQPFVEQGKILARDKQTIEKNLDDYVLIFSGDELVACAGLKDCQEGLMGEIYSLAVKQSQQNTGLSVKLLEKLLDKAKAQGFSKVFALTKHGTNWFTKHGFVKMNISDLPQNRQRYFDHQRNSSIFFKDVN